MVEDTCFTAYDICLTCAQGCNRRRSGGTVLKAIWENIEKLPPFHPAFNEWTRERAVDPDVTIPYHPGAIQFL